MKHLPNILTIARFFITGLFIFYFQHIARDGFPAAFLAALMFALASITDFFDGYLARKFQVISAFGKIADPIADKFLVLSAFILFACSGIIDLWMVALISAREIGITIFRFVAIGQGRVLAAEMGGKLKTVIQIATISVILLFILFSNMIMFKDQQFLLNSFFPLTISILMWLTLLITLYSGFTVLWHNRK